MADLQPTEEQQAIVDAFTDGFDIAVQARAGSGKSQCCEFIARSTNRVGSYQTFSKVLADEAATRLPMNVTSSTTHAIAMRAVGKTFRHRLDSPRVPSWRLAKWLGIGPIVVTGPLGTKVMQPSYLAGWVLRAVELFCQSDHLVPSERHFPRVDSVDRPGEWTNNDLLRREMVDVLQDAWEDLSTPDGRLPYRHSHYLKSFELGEPVLPGEFVLCDELQDHAAVQVSIVRKSKAKTGQQLVAIGDPEQSIFGWRGAVNAFDLIDTDQTLSLSMSFRFGQEVADVANLVLEQLGARPLVVGHPDISSRVGELADPRAILCRTNAMAVSTVLNLQKQGKKVHLVGGSEDVVRFARAAAQLQAGEKTSHPDLACFDSWNEVREYSRSDPSGGDLSLLVRLLDEFGVQIVLDALAGMLGEDAADVLVSTAHRSKGRTLSSVRLAGDFPDETTGEAGRLLYVGVTRAREVLDVRSCEPIMELRRKATKVTA